MIFILPIMMAFFIFMFWSSLKAYKDARLSEHRQTLFRLRKHWFNLAAENQMSFDSPIYKHTRNMINGHILMAEKISITHFLVMIFLYRKHETQIKLEIEQRNYQGRKGATDEQVEFALKVSKNLSLCSAYHLFTKNFIVYSLIRFLLLFPNIKPSYEKKQEKQGNIISSFAYNYC